MDRTGQKFDLGGMQFTVTGPASWCKDADGVMDWMHPIQVIALIGALEKALPQARDNLLNNLKFFQERYLITLPNMKRIQ